MKSTLALSLLVAASLGSACSSTSEAPVSTSQPAESESPPASASSSGNGSSSSSGGSSSTSSSGGSSTSSSGGSSSGGVDSGMTTDSGVATEAGVTDSGAPPDAGSPVVAFTKAELQALLNAHCDGCHIGGASGGMSLAGDFTVQTVGVASTEVPNLKRIHAGKRAESYLFHKIAGTHASVGGFGARMPKGGPYLSALEIERVGLFIDGL